MDKLAAAKAFLAGRYCLAIPVFRADQRPWVEPPPVPLYLREGVPEMVQRLRAVVG